MLVVRVYFSELCDGSSLQTTALVFCSNTAALPAQTNGYIRVDCYGGLNQMRRDVSFRKHERV